MELRDFTVLDEESRQELVVPVLREYLPKIGITEEAEVVIGMWCECIWEGMDELLSHVAAQAILNDRALSLNQLYADPKRLLKAEIIQSGNVFWRIYLHLLQRVISESNRQNVPDAKITEFKAQVVEFLFSYAEMQEASRRIILTFIHQMFLENSVLIKELHSSDPPPYSIEMIPWVIEYAPSTHVLIESLHAKIVASQSLNLFQSYLCVYLSIKYPMPTSQDLCKEVINHCEKYGGNSAKDAKESLQILVLTLQAFPSLMAMVAPILSKWSATFSTDVDFAKATMSAAQKISQIASLVNLPIFRKNHNLL